MQKQPVVWLALALFVGGTIAGALSTGDSLVSQSYAVGTYISAVREKAKDTVEKNLRETQKKVDALDAKTTDTQLKGSVEAQVLAALGKSSKVDLQTGHTITAQTGTEVIVMTGKAVTRKGIWLNLSTGRQAGLQHALVGHQRYLAAEDGAELILQQDSTLKISGRYESGESSVQTENAQYTDYADALHTLGLFQGSQKGYELARSATRAEGIVMLIRLLGDEAEAKAYTGKHPFIDVPAWANSYIGYAYKQGYTSGISKTQFGSTMQLRYHDYMTFLLRALGYSDRGGDFSWENADKAAVDHGIQTEQERLEIKKQGRFVRDHVAYTSYRTLFAKTKEGTRLCDQLVRRGVFSQKQLDAAEQKGL